MNFFSFCHEENLSSSLSVSAAAESTAVAHVLASFQTSGSPSETPSSSENGHGQSASDFHKNGGPLTHLVAVKKASAVSPREASSAGFNFVSTCLHCDGSEPSRIIAILFATNVRNLLSSFLMYFSTVVLLVQKCDVSMGSCSSFLISLSRLISTVAADNSSCGMEMLFKGTSLDLAIMKAQ